MRGSWRPNRTAICWPPLLWRSALCLSRSSDAQPEARCPSSLLDKLSLPHIVSNSSDLHLIDFLSSPSYIIVQSSTQYLWNGMFDRHQAEITVMQFTGHSLPVHQSMTVHGILPCPISSAKPAYAISSHNCHRNVSLPSGASLWNGMLGRVEGLYTTVLIPK